MPKIVCKRFLTSVLQALVLLGIGSTAQFRAEFFNVTNHPNWGNPNAGVFVQGGSYNAIAGQITTLRVPMRQTQFALKLIF